MNLILKHNTRYFTLRVMFLYRGADKSLVRSGMKEARTTKL